ncbi:hypothetical protein JCM24511_01876 [Saitozyma sp. JCM 24511]|nr:hypothetical protein JCM24511_01876 [Saitozyma sp. JCM 24511]
MTWKRECYILLAEGDHTLPQVKSLGSGMVADTTYYDLLEVSVEATENPDDPMAHEMFQQIGQAYETLSNPNDRATYDEFGPDGPPRGGGVDPSDMDDLFASMFGGFGFGMDGGMGGAGFSFDSAGPSRKPRKMRDTDVAYEISLEEAFKGKRVVMALERDRVLGGFGLAGQEGTCWGGMGRDRAGWDGLGPGLVGKMKVPCEDCEGEGVRVPEKQRCKKCKGKKVVKEKKRVEFHILPGTEHGERIALRGEGDEMPEVPPGDIIFHIHILPHSTFRRLGDSHLGATVPLRLSEALLGFNRVLFVHLDGRGIRVESKRGERVIRHGEELCIRGEGMPRLDRDGGGKGNLRVRFEVEMPGASWAARSDAQGGGVVEQMAKG